MLFIEYPKCSTCQKAKKFLEANGIPYTDRHIVEDNPSVDELKEWIARSKMPMKKFFNTSGVLYRQLELKDKLPNMTEEQQLAVLASNGMLLKRPVLVLENNVLVGFKEAAWAEALNN